MGWLLAPRRHYEVLYTDRLLRLRLSVVDQVIACTTYKAGLLIHVFHCGLL